MDDSGTLHYRWLLVRASFWALPSNLCVRVGELMRRMTVRVLSWYFSNDLLSFPNNKLVYFLS